MTIVKLCELFLHTSLIVKLGKKIDLSSLLMRFLKEWSRYIIWRNNCLKFCLIFIASSSIHQDERFFIFNLSRNTQWTLKVIKWIFNSLPDTKYMWSKTLAFITAFLDIFSLSEVVSHNLNVYNWYTYHKRCRQLMVFKCLR